MKSIKKFFKYWYYFIMYYITIKLEIFKYSKPKNSPIQWEHVARVKLFALLQHHKVRQKYDGYPYYFHLKQVGDNTAKWIDLVDYNLDCIKGAYLHDIIEDIHSWTYNPLKDKFGLSVAEIVFACTELRGRNRNERHGKEYYDLLRKNELGAYVKICDVISNMERGKLTGSSMFKKYKKEYPHFKEMMYNIKYHDLFEHIENNIIK